MTESVPFVGVPSGLRWCRWTFYYHSDVAFYNRHYEIPARRTLSNHTVHFFKWHA